MHRDAKEIGRARVSSGLTVDPIFIAQFSRAVRSHSSMKVTVYLFPEEVVLVPEHVKALLLVGILLYFLFL